MIHENLITEQNYSDEAVLKTLPGMFYINKTFRGLSNINPMNYTYGEIVSITHKKDLSPSRLKFYEGGFPDIINISFFVKYSAAGNFCFVDSSKILINFIFYSEKEEYENALLKHGIQLEKPIKGIVEY